jgi:hypothetical protein
MNLSIRLSLFIVLIFQLIPPLTYGQARNSIGLEGGVSITKLSALEYPNGILWFVVNSDAIVSLNGAVFGGQLELALSGNIFFEYEVLYVHSGYKTDFIWSLSGDPSPHSGYLERHVDYLALPFHAKYKIQSSYIKPFFFLGPDLRIKVSSETKYWLDGRPWYSISYDSFEALDLSFEGGIGCEIPFTNSLGFQINARYEYGFTDIPQQEGFHWKSRSIQILAGIKYSPMQ